jgi:hypothetical protein
MAPRSFAALLSSPEYRSIRATLLRKYIARKPCVAERAALDAAALLSLRAQLAAVDPDVSADALAKLTAASRGALAVLAEVTKGRRCVRVRSRNAAPKLLPSFEVQA